MAERGEDRRRRSRPYARAAATTEGGEIGEESLSQDAYISTEHKSVPGWSSRLELELLASIDEVHRDAGVTGDLLEIGCYLGQTAVLLGFFRRGADRLTVCDLFGAEAPSGSNTWENTVSYGSLTEQEFRQNFARFHTSPPEVLVCPSEALPQQIAQRSYRLIHVDGSHHFDVVAHDIELTASLTAPHGMVVFDDLCSAHTPGVPAAVWHAVADAGLHPLVCSTKLYATWERTDVHDRWMRHVEQRFRVGEQEIQGQRVLIAHDADTSSGSRSAAEMSPTELARSGLRAAKRGSHRIGELLRGLRT